jgi:excisionase family DNA binding protein
LHIIAARLIGVSVDTLRRWEKAGKITSTRTAGGHRRYDLAEHGITRKADKLKKVTVGMPE